jgi:hypothetical protein
MSAHDVQTCDEVSQSLAAAAAAAARRSAPAPRGAVSTPWSLDLEAPR